MNDELKEEEIQFSKPINEILEQINFSENQIYEEGDVNNIIKLKKHPDNSIYNNINLTQYKNIYFGGVSQSNPTIREGYGLNFYYDNNNNLNSFYAGEWVSNSKEGIGLMNISNEKYFFGNFTYNQFKYGILFYLNTNYVYFGEFNEGNFEKGIIFKNEDNKRIIYRGSQTKERKKEGGPSVYHEIDNGTFFFGNFINDEPIKGLLVVYKTPNELNEEQIIEFEKIFYFDKKESGIKYTIQSSFGDEQQDKAAQIASLFLQKDYSFIENISLVFQQIKDKIDKILNNSNYKNILGKYNNISDKLYKSLNKKYEQIFEIYLVNNLEGGDEQGINDEEFNKEEDFSKEHSTPLKPISIKVNLSSSVNSQNNDFKYGSSK